MRFPRTAQEHAEQTAVIEADMEFKKKRKDRHGVMDCSADLRELDAYWLGYQDGVREATKNG